MLSLQPHLNSAPTGPMQAFSEMLPLSGNLVSGYQRTFLIQTLRGWRPFYIHNIEHAAHASKHCGMLKNKQSYYMLLGHTYFKPFYNQKKNLLILGGQFTHNAPKMFVSPPHFLKSYVFIKTLWGLLKFPDCPRTSHVVD